MTEIENNIDPVNYYFNIVSVVGSISKEPDRITSSAAGSREALVAEDVFIVVI